ncbi:hypothetical protein [Coleofasciculus sp. H7-2]|uniref:hypothetical protein n=1 Tax=Coleofasciculus sp. H7-2 TaxID=3351545 RepID=UPI00366D811D
MFVGESADIDAEFITHQLTLSYPKTCSTVNKESDRALGIAIALFGVWRKGD